MLPLFFLFELIIPHLSALTVKYPLSFLYINHRKAYLSASSCSGMEMTWVVMIAYLRFARSVTDVWIVRLLDLKGKEVSC